MRAPQAPIDVAARRRWLGLAAVLAGTFVGTINNSVANVAVLDVIDEFDVPLTSGAWFVTGYVLAFAVLMPAAGWLGDVVGIRRVYVAGLALFAVASVAVALAPTYPAAAGARVVQGIANAPVLPTVMVTVAAAFPAGMRGRAVGWWAAVNGAAIALGPPLAGVIAESWGWRTVFWLDVPLVLATLVLTWRALPPDQPSDHPHTDVVGGGLLTAGLVAVMLGASQGPERGWSDPVVGLVAITGVAMLVTFWRRSHRVSSPFLAVDILRSRAVAALSGVAGLQMTVLFGVLFTTPLLLTELFDQSLGQAGAVAFVLPVSMMLAGPSMGHLADRYGARLLVAMGGGVLVAATALMGVGIAQRSLPVLIASLVLFGMGVSAIQSPATAAVAEHVGDTQRGAAMGMFHATRFLCGVFGTAIAAAVIAGAGGTTAVGSIPDRTLERAFLAALAVSAAVAVAVVIASRAVPPQTSSTAPETSPADASTPTQPLTAQEVP